MSEIQAAFRQLGGEALDGLTDDELTLFIGQNFPQLKNHPKFGVEYGAIKEDRDKAIIDGLQASIANDEVQLAKPTGLKLAERIGLGLAQGVGNVAKSAGAAALAIQKDGASPIPALNIPLVRQGVEAVVGGARGMETELGEAGESVGGGLGGEFAQALGAGAASLVPSVISAFFGGMPAAMGTAGVLQFGDTFDTAFEAYKAQGMSPEQAREEALKLAVLSGVVTAGLTGVGGAERFFARLGRGKIAMNTARAVLEEIVKSAGLEGVEEGTDQFIQGVIRQATFEPNKPFSSVLRDSAMAAAVGFTLGAVLPGAGMLAKKASDSASKVGKLPQKGAKPVQELQVRQPQQIMAGEMLTGREDFDLFLGGRPTPVIGATLTEDGQMRLSLEGGESLTLQPSDPLQVIQKPPKIDDQSTKEPPKIAEPGQVPPVFPDEAALRAVPAPVAALDSFINWSLARDPGAPPVIDLKTDTAFPDYMPREEAKATLTQPFGISKWPILGKLFDPNARHLTDVGEMANTLNAEYAIGDAIASAYGVQIQGKWDAEFPVGGDGFLVGVEPTQAGQSLAPSDVIESLMRDPGSYRITPGQADALAQMQSAVKEVKALLQKYGVLEQTAQEDGENGNPESYLPRIVIERPAKEGGVAGKGRRMGGKQFFEKSRVFQAEADGIAAGYKYEPSIERRFTTFVQRAYRRIAEKRFIDDPDLEKVPRQTMEAQLREQFRSRGTMTDQGVEQAVSNALQEMTPDNRAFSGFAYPPETVQELNRAFPASEWFMRKYFTRANNFVKMLRLGYDLGAFFNQGIISFFAFPRQWAQASFTSMHTMLRPEAFAAWARNNTAPIREAMQLGMSVGRLPEFLAGAERGSFLEDNPVTGGVTRAFARQFQTFLDVSKIEIFKSYRGAARPDELMELVRSIESVMLSGRMEAIGVGPNQSFLERAMFLAPAYYRGAVNLVGMIGSRGISGRVAMRALGGYGIGGLFLFGALARLFGMDWEEIRRRLNPTNSEFMNWRFPLENGNVVNFGLGGIMKSFVKLLANVSESIVNGEWDKFTKGTSEENPFVRWYRAHSAPVPSIVWDFASGRDYMGGETDAGVIFGGLLPLSIQSLIARDYQRERSLGEKAATLGVESVGISTHHESFGRSRMAELDKIGKEQHQKPYSELNVTQRGSALKAFEDTEVFKGRPEMPPELMARLDKENLKALENEMSGEALDALEDAGLTLNAPKLAFRSGGRNIVLTEKERERFVELIADESSAAIEKNAERLAKEQDREKKEEMLSDLMKTAKAKALAALRKELPDAD